MHSAPLPEPAEHQTSSRSRPMRQRLLESLHVKAGAAAPRIGLFCQNLVARSFLGTRVCQGVTVYVLAVALAARGIWEGSTDIHVPCKSRKGRLQKLVLQRNISVRKQRKYVYLCCSLASSPVG